MMVYRLPDAERPHRAGGEPGRGNLPVTQSLPNITGVGPPVGINVRHNNQNDLRPTLNLGLFEVTIHVLTV